MKKFLPKETKSRIKKTLFKLRFKTCKVRYKKYNLRKKIRIRIIKTKWNNISRIISKNFLLRTRS